MNKYEWCRVWDLLIARYDLANLANGQALATGEQIGARRRSVIESAVRQPPQQQWQTKKSTAKKEEIRRTH